MSEREAKLLSGLSYVGKSVFTRRDVRRFVREPKNLLDSLVRKRWILKIRKGVYAIAPFEAGERGAGSYTLHPFVIASVLVNPYYIGYWSALNHHGLTDATPPAVYVASTKPRHTRRILDSEFRFVTIPRTKLFGVGQAEVEGRRVAVSSPEKTIVDCLDHPEHAGGVEEVAKALHFHDAELDAKKLVAFAERIGNNAVVKRLGFLGESLDLKPIAEPLSRAKLAAGYSLLDPTSPKRGHIKERWRVVANVPLDPSRWTK